MVPGIIVFSVVVATVFGFPDYQTRIPNGASVPNPCGSGIWGPVGHFDPSHHTTYKNVFGRDFSAAGHTWSSSLCRMDSDGDGLTNGEELGDPNCSWTVGAVVSGSPRGHPGICEPVGSTRCSSQAFTCGCKGANCVGK